MLFWQVILVQVNPGETFTIRGEDGTIQCIQGKRFFFFGSLLIKGVFFYFNKVECFSVSTYDFSRSKIYLGIKKIFFSFSFCQIGNPLC